MAIYKRKGVRHYWFAFTFNGERVQRSTKCSNKNDARDVERAAWVQLAKNEVGIGRPKREIRTVTELLDPLKARYEQDGKLSKQNESLIRRAGQDFGSKIATQLTTEHLEKYIVRRRAEGAANATINRVIEILRRAFRLAQVSLPKIPHLSERDNVRQGFFSIDEFRALQEHLPADLKDFCHFAYLTGWRRNEIRSLAWSDVDGSRIQVRAANAKNRCARSVGVAGELKAIIERRQQERLVDGVLTGLVFHRNGERIGEFKKSWNSACVLAGLGAMTCPKCGEFAKEGERTICRRCKRQRTYSGKIFHDFRRTAARDLIRAGNSEGVTMKILGHKTRSMFDRYNIASESDTSEAMERLEKFHAATDEKVIAIAK